MGRLFWALSSQHNHPMVLCDGAMGLIDEPRPSVFVAELFIGIFGA
jgi:hypothetical protein